MTTTMLKFAELQTATAAALESYYETARKLSEQHFGKTLKVYYPGRDFPSVSITGSFCAQNCLYCNKHYLQQMEALTTPEKLEAYAFNLARRKGKGLLISGGYNTEARLPIEPFLPTLAKIKRETDLILNLHPGLVSEEQAKAFAEIGIDEISFDLVVNDEVIQKVINPNLTGKDYLRAYAALKNAGLKVAPHIMLGLFFGEMQGEIEAVKAAFSFDPKLIVFLALIPTKGTPMAAAPQIAPAALGKMLVFTRMNRPEIELSLGCMRVRKREYETIALKAGINRLAVPKHETLAIARDKFEREIIKANYCCTID